MSIWSYVYFVVLFGGPLCVEESDMSICMCTFAPAAISPHASVIGHLAEGCEASPARGLSAGRGRRAGGAHTRARPSTARAATVHRYSTLIYHTYISLP